MTDYADLEKRLRGYADTLDNDAADFQVNEADEMCANCEEWAALQREAADALASLTRELEEAKGLLVRASLYTDLTKFSDEIGAFLSREASD